jgi:hypothetical protein
MIRQNRLIERNASWRHQPFTTADTVALEATWRDWAMHEALKRYFAYPVCKS